jgi:aspartate/glutamate racemase
MPSRRPPLGTHEAIAQAAHRLDAVGADLLAHAAHEHLDGVAVAVEVLIVQVLDQFGPLITRPWCMIR